MVLVLVTFVATVIVHHGGCLCGGLEDEQSTANSRCGGASTASRSKSSLHEGVGGQRLGYLHVDVSYICKHMHGNAANMNFGS